MKEYDFVSFNNNWGSASYTGSIHRTREGTLKAKEAHKAATVIKYPAWRLESNAEYGNVARWDVMETDLLD